MPTLNEAEAALATAQDAKETTRLASVKAATDAAALRAKVASGGRGSAKITPADIAAADQAAEFAALAYQGAAADVHPLAAAVKEARANEACDEVLAGLPGLSQDVLSALLAIEAALPQLVAAAERYDAFVELAVHRLEKVAPNVEPTYEAGSGLNPHRIGGTAASPFVHGPETPLANPEPAPVQRSRFKAPRHGSASVDCVPLTSCRAPDSSQPYCCRP